MKNNPKIFIGFSEVANYYTNLLKGFKKLGIEYEFFNYGENKRKYDCDISKSLIQEGFNSLSILQFKYANNKFFKNIFYFLHITLRIPLFLYSLSKYNIFIFNYNASFFGLYDLPILKFFNKKIIYIFHGSDSRPPYMSGNYIYENYSIEDVFQITKKLNKRNKKIEKYADYIICGAASSQFFNRELIHYLAIGAPIDLSHIHNTGQKNANTINIIHAPSGRKQKGSDYFAQIIKELIDEGYPIDYEELFNVPNRVVLEKLSASDFVLDELYSDTTLAGLGTEAAYFSKPTIVGGYYEQIARDLKTIPVPPSLYVEPTKIKEAIIKLIENTEFRLELGNEVKHYTSERWNPSAVSERLLQIIQNDIPDAWFFDASKSDYFYGWGVSKEALKEFLKRYIGQYGKEGLFISHNPNLENKILNFIKD